MKKLRFRKNVKKIVDDATKISIKFEKPMTILKR